MLAIDVIIGSSYTHTQARKKLFGMPTKRVWLLHIFKGVWGAETWGPEEGHNDEHQAWALYNKLKSEDPHEGKLVCKGPKQDATPEMC